MKKNNNNISIIMPLYNARKYIERCLNSFIPFLGAKDEVIIVDDASTDGSSDLVKDYIKQHKDKNIILLHNDKNIGAGLSRNRALEKAKGDYIGFIDSDDYVDKEYFQKMLSLAMKENSDIVVSDISIVDDNKEQKFDLSVNNLYDNSKKMDVNIDKRLVFGHWSWASSCTKLFKRAIIQDLKFSSKKSDDVLFTAKALMRSHKISYCMDNYYYYYQSSYSLTRNSSYEKYEESLICLFEVVNFLYPLDLEIAKIYAANSLFPTICYSLNDISIEDLEKFLDVVKTGFTDSTKVDTLFENIYLKRNMLYRSKLYRKELNLIRRGDYQEIISLISNLDTVKDRHLTSSRPVREDFSPLVSIVIPVYNGANYVKEAIDCALSQTYKNIEVIVVNDGSKDETDEICRQYGDKIRYFKKENGGVSSALNLAIKNMRGEYFSWLSHDDLYYNDKVERQVRYLSSLPEENVVLFNNYILINENGRRLGEPVILNHKMLKKKPEYCLLRGCLNGITLLIPKKAFSECGNFNELLRCTQDYDMWMRIAKKFKFIHMKDILTKTRIHSLQDTNSNPLVISEGNKLWIRMIKDISDERKIALEGSIYNYYYRMARHLRFSPYDEAIKYCVEQCKHINSSKYLKKPYDYVNNSIANKFFYSIKEFGIVYTFRLILKKVFKW